MKTETEARKQNRATAEDYKKIADYERIKRDYYSRKGKEAEEIYYETDDETQKAESYYYKTLAEHHDLLKREAESISEHYKRKAEEEEDHDQEVPF